MESKLSAHDKHKLELIYIKAALKKSGQYEYLDNDMKRQNFTQDILVIKQNHVY